MEIRIYYEALEQGIVIRNIINKLLSNSNSNVLLIYKRKQSYNNNFKVAYSKELSKILAKKNPDIIISHIYNWIEYPIFIIEFSTAVFTKDHEQQRADNFLVAVNSNALYIKVSPTKKDSWNHGWDTKYSYIEPYSLCYKKFNQLSFHLEWGLDENISKLAKNKLYKSLPKNIDKLSDIFSIFFSNIEEYIPYKWKNNFINKEKFNKNEFILNWINKLEKYNDYENIKTLSSTRTNYLDRDEKLDKEKVFYLKFNRFWHAMDPERWMLIFYNTFLIPNDVTVVSKIIMDLNEKSWYKDVNKEKEIELYIKNKKNLLNRDLIYLFFLWLNLKWFDKLNINEENNIFNIDDYVDNVYLSAPISFRNIIDNSSYLNLTDWIRNVYLTWTNKVRGYNYKSLPDISKIVKQSKYREDDITYITVHNIFKENWIDIISISYPWAQSDMPILPEKEKWRRQKRVYIDVIWNKWKNLYFQENKWSFKKREVKDDIEKISLFKTEKYINAVNEFSEDNGINYSRLVLWVWFWNSKSFTLDDIWIEKVDYFVIIDKEKNLWKVFTNNINWIFSKTTWKILKPETFEVKDK